LINITGADSLYLRMWKYFKC